MKHFLSGIALFITSACGQHSQEEADFENLVSQIEVPLSTALTASARRPCGRDDQCSENPYWTPQMPGYSATFLPNGDSLRNLQAIVVTWQESSPGHMSGELSIGIDLNPRGMIQMRGPHCVYAELNDGDYDGPRGNCDLLDPDTVMRLYSLMLTQVRSRFNVPG